VLLKVLSAKEDGPVYLAAVRGEKKPWAIKTMPLQGQGAVNLDLFKSEAKRLARMHFAHLARVLEAAPIEDQLGLVMEYVPGKSLAEICQRAEEYEFLLPPEIGLVVAHDVFAAAEFFHAFEGAGRVHGNISPRTILVRYSGDAKLAGYRPGYRKDAGIGAHMAVDLKPLASLLFDLRFQMFPKELTQLVPRLLEENVSPVEGMAAVKAFLHDHAPSAGQRQSVAAWMEDVFQEHSYAQEAHEEDRLLAAGTHMLGPSPTRAKNVSVVGGAITLLALVGGGGLLMAHRGPGPALPEANPIEATAPAVSIAPPPAALPPVNLTSPSPLTNPVTRLSTNPVTPPEYPPQPRSDTPDHRTGKLKSDESPADRLLRAADAAFDKGMRIQAIHLSIQALAEGGGNRAHLALGEYYRSIHRYQEAMNHYHAVIESDPENKLAATGIQVLDKKLSPCR
jgi:tetratricopeptide (TPR) repeat protein